MDNQEFLSAVFGADAPFVHVTDFPDDPNDIPADRHLVAWRGDWASRYQLREGTNQYFTISIFNPDDRGIARRRKALYLRTPCIVLDDVREKLDINEVKKLPEPSWVLETSPGSEQWGYILDEPCHDRYRVENLLDGLVANGLAPDGRDPGMKGVTRYVRLPGGYNTKKSKMVNGQPFKCQLLEWRPLARVTLEELATPFKIDLDAVRREGRVDGAAEIPDHPLLQIPDLIHIKEVRSKGRFDITCPWVDEHTGEVDNGTAIFTNQDGTMGFKCHHGACETRTGADLLDWIGAQEPDFRGHYKQWQLVHQFKKLNETFPPLTFIDPEPPLEPTPAPIGHMTEETARAFIEKQVSIMAHMLPGTPERDAQVETILKACDDLSALEQKHFHDLIAHQQQWTKAEFAKVLKKLRTEWYKKDSTSETFYNDFIYIHDVNRIYNQKTRIFYTVEAFKYSFMDRDADIVKTALQDGSIRKVHRLDFAPDRPLVWEEDGLMHGNLYVEEMMSKGLIGDPSPWLDHLTLLGFSKQQTDHLMKWMAYTIRNPGTKVNHLVLIGGTEGIGKDFILTPIVRFLGRYARIIEGHTLVANFNSFLVGTKLLIINETELFDHRDAQTVSTRLKPLAAAPPDKLIVNQKNVPEIEINNIVNTVMTTNKRVPLRLDGASRRIFALWSDLDIRDERGQITDEWSDYFRGLWNWMNNGGDQIIIHHLLNNVDISSFDPGRPPPYTDFLEDITECSKSPIMQSIEFGIQNRIGKFDADLLTAHDISKMMQAGTVFSEMLMFGAKTSWFTPTRVGKALSEMVGIQKLRGRKGAKEVRLWALRDAAKYQKLSTTELYEEYEKQLKVADRVSYPVGVKQVY